MTTHELFVPTALSPPPPPVPPAVGEREAKGLCSFNYYSNIRPPHWFMPELAPPSPGGARAAGTTAPPSPSVGSPSRAASVSQQRPGSPAFGSTGAGFRLPVTALTASNGPDERRLAAAASGGSVAAGKKPGTAPAGRQRPASPAGAGALPRPGTISASLNGSRPVSALGLSPTSSGYGRVERYVSRPRHLPTVHGLLAAEAGASQLYAEFERLVEASRDKSWAPEQARMEAAVVAATAAIAEGREGVRVIDFLSHGRNDTAAAASAAAAAGGEAGAELAAGGDGRVLELRCQFNALNQHGDQRGRIGRPVYPVPPIRSGPLRTLFEWYARKDDAVEVRAGTLC